MNSRLALLLSTLLVVGGRGSVAFAGNGVSVEATNVYNTCNIYPDLWNNITNVDGLYNGMTPVGGLTWTQAIHWTNGDAWDSDMLDSDVTTGSDLDTMDRTGSPDAISMYSGHGSCDNWSTQTCTTAADCTSPGIGQSLPGVCTKNPGAATGYCMYYVPRKAVTCGTYDSHGHNAPLSTLARYGESSSGNCWRSDAGCNGGTNFVIQDISCGATPGLQTNEYWGPFAGSHIISTVMPTVRDSDTLDSTTRGAGLSAEYRANPNSSVAASWAYAMNYVTGGSCNGNEGHGISGCGAYISYTVAEDQSWAEYLNFTEDWYGIQNDGNDSYGAGYMAWTYLCNFDCNTYPLSY